MNVLISGPFETNGRYPGGIYSIVNNLYDDKDSFEKENIFFMKFNTSLIKRTKKQGNFNIDNIKNFFALYKKIFAVINTNSIDVIYYHSSVKFALLKDLIILRRIKQCSSIKIVLHIHFADLDEILCRQALIKKIMKKYMMKLDKIVYLSKVTQQRYELECKKPNNSTCVYNYIIQDKAQLNSLDYSNSKKINLLFMGSLDKRKGILDLLKALKYTSIDFKLYICGEYTDSEIKNQIISYVNEFPDEIEVLGYVKGQEKRKIFEKTDILILPSYGEGLPLVILEAYSYGCAVIATNVGAISEILTTGENGMLIAPGDINSLTRSIEKLSNIELLNYVKNNNLLESKKYTYDNFKKSIVEILKGVYYYEHK